MTGRREIRRRGREKAARETLAHRTDELHALLGPLAASPRCAGINITVYEPDADRDPEGTGAVLLAGLLEDVFAQP